MLSLCTPQRRCLQCLAPIVGGSPKKLFCSHACRIEHRRDKREASGSVIIGTELSCKKCGASFAKKHKRQFYCDNCTTVKANTGRRIGHMWPCANCGKKTLISHPRMVYCDDCHALQKRGALRSIRVAMATRTKARLRADPQFALSRNMGAGIWRSIGDRKAGRSWESLVPYTIDDLILHLERQFLADMTWGNRSEWHVDHIQPLASFTFASPDDPEFQAAWALSNLRPLWANDNLQKSAKRQFLI